MNLRNLVSLLSTTVLLTAPSLAFATITSSNLCTGPNALLSLVNRPSVLDSVCVVPQHDTIWEMGSNWYALLDEGSAVNLPQAVYRHGFADYFEFSVILPSYYHESVQPRAGFGPTTLEVKHELVANEKWATSIEGLCTLPSGSYAFGSHNPGGAFNSITTLNLTEELSATTMIGVSSISESTYSGGQSFISFNPIGLLAWTKDKLSIYAEISAQTKTGIGEGSGVNMDLGCIYLFRKNITLDFSVGQRLKGNIGGFSHYVGAGLSVQY